MKNLFTRENIPIDVIISPEKRNCRLNIKKYNSAGAFEIIEFGEKDFLLGVT